MAATIGIVDYGMGNLHSIYKKVKRLGVDCKLISKEADFSGIDKIMLPGVGHFATAIQHLKERNILEVLNEKVLVEKKAILGICLGMQLLAERSEEGEGKGLGWIEGEVVRFDINDKLLHKVPHVGWNQVSICKESQLMKNIPESAALYFVHSYHFNVAQEGDALNKTDYESAFVSAVEKENIFGVQYHPEKSHDIGEQVFRNFIAL